jgi:hypothetical protein
MSEHTARPLRPALLWTVAAASFAIACVFVYCQIFSLELPDYFFPDETAAYDVFRGRGLVAGVWYYWANFIGRPSAMTWLGLPIVLTQRLLHINPWYAVVGTRMLNYLVALAALAFLLRTVLRRLQWCLSLAVAALLLAAVLAGVGTMAVKYYWLADQSIYGFSFVAYCLVLALFWRLALGGIDKHAWWLPAAFLLYLGAHEVNLVAGGLMLALYFFCLVPRFLDRSLDRASLTMFATLSAIYVAMAYLEVFSPSLGFRYQVFAADKTWLEAAKLGFPAAFFPLLELGLGWNGAILPVLLSGIIAGAWNGAPSPLDRRRIWLFLAPLGFAVVVSVLMGVLSSRYSGLMDPFYNFSDAKIFPLIERFGLISLPVRQNIYSYQLWFTGLFSCGAAIGAYSRGLRVAGRDELLPLAAVACVGWLATVSVTSKTFADARHFDLRGRIASMAAWLRPLSEPPGFDGTRYLEEPPPEMYAQWGWDKNPIGHPKGTTYPLDVALQDMFHSGPIAFVPCGVAGAGAKAECIQENIPWLERRIDSAVSELEGIWRIPVGGQAVPAQDQLAFVEDAENREHYLATGDLLKGARTLVQVRAIIATQDIVPGAGISVVLASEDGAASVQFDLAEARIDDAKESGARALDGSSRRLANNAAGASRFEFNARFVVVGEKDRFQIRLQSTRKGQTAYQGDGQSGWRVETLLIRMLDTGSSVSRLQSKPSADRPG